MKSAKINQERNRNGTLKSRDVWERFNEKTNRLGGIPSHVPGIGHCWVWIGSVTRKGRTGWFYLNGNLITCHRASWIMHNGKIPNGLFVLHKCDNPICVNPAHLFLGTQQDNMADMNAKGRFVASVGEKHGHAKLTESDVRVIILELFAGEDKKSLAEKFGVHWQTIHLIESGKTWKHLTTAEQKKSL